MTAKPRSSAALQRRQRRSTRRKQERHETLKKRFSIVGAIALLASIATILGFVMDNGGNATLPTDVAGVSSSERPVNQSEGDGISPRPQSLPIAPPLGVTVNDGGSNRGSAGPVVTNGNGSPVNVTVNAGSGTLGEMLAKLIEQVRNSSELRALREKLDEREMKFERHARVLKTILDVFRTTVATSSQGLERIAKRATTDNAAKFLSAIAARAPVYVSSTDEQVEAFNIAGFPLSARNVARRKKQHDAIEAVLKKEASPETVLLACGALENYMAYTVIGMGESLTSWTLRRSRQFELERTAIKLAREHLQQGALRSSNRGAIEYDSDGLSRGKATPPSTPKSP